MERLTCSPIAQARSAQESGAELVLYPPAPSLPQRFPEGEEEEDRLEAGTPPSQGGCSCPLCHLELCPPVNRRSHGGGEDFIFPGPALALGNPGGREGNGRRTRWGGGVVGVKATPLSSFL